MIPFHNPFIHDHSTTPTTKKIITNENDKVDTGVDEQAQSLLVAVVRAQGGAHQQLLSIWTRIKLTLMVIGNKMRVYVTEYVIEYRFKEDEM